MGLAAVAPGADASGEKDWGTLKIGLPAARGFIHKTRDYTDSPAAVTPCPLKLPIRFQFEFELDHLSNYFDNEFMKALRFIGSSLDDLQDFPAEARRAAGFELFSIQRGLMPSDFKPMLTIGPGAYELRVHVLGEWRVIYVAKFAEAIYVLHAFQKKTQKTQKTDIELARRRYSRIGDFT